MAVKIRLKRLGKRKQPFYRIVAIDESKKRQGREIENLGYYDPVIDPPGVKLNKERISYWLSVGARSSETVGYILKKNLKK